MVLVMGISLVSIFALLISARTILGRRMCSVVSSAYSMMMSRYTRQKVLLSRNNIINRDVDELQNP
jgi:hypothetical protein